MKVVVAARWWIAVAWVAVLFALFLIDQIPRQYVPWTVMVAPTGLACHAGITVLVALVLLFIGGRETKEKIFGCMAVVWVIDLLAMHQDYWFWTNKYLLFGIVPLGLAYHAGFTILAAVTLFTFTRTIWPKHLEEEEHNLPPGGPRSGGAH